MMKEIDPCIILFSWKKNYFNVAKKKIINFKTANSDALVSIEFYPKCRQGPQGYLSLETWTKWLVNFHTMLCETQQKNTVLL